MPEGTSQPCPSCGINVMRGYTKCPKCHAPMPGAGPRSRRASFGGGTTSQPMERIAEGGGGTWIWAVLGILFVGGALLWATQLRGRGSSKKPVEAPAPIDDGTGTGSDDTIQPTGDVPPDRVPSAPTAPDPAYTADALEGELSMERLFATVEIAEDLIDIRSAFCADPRFGEITARYAGDLKAAGVTRIRCSETHGAQVFERPL